MHLFMTILKFSVSIVCVGGWVCVGVCGCGWVCEGVFINSQVDLPTTGPILTVVYLLPLKFSVVQNVSTKQPSPLKCFH